MAEKIVFYGRVNGKVRFKYGPRKFSANWGGAFTAMEIVNLITKLPKVPLTKHTPILVKATGSAAEKVNHQMWLNRLESSLISLDLVYLGISATKVNRFWVDKVLPSRYIRFAGKRQKPSLILAKTLHKMGLNHWGVLKELTAAMSEFDSKITTTGTRAASVFFKF